MPWSSHGREAHCEVVPECLDQRESAHRLPLMSFPRDSCQRAPTPLQPAAAARPGTRRGTHQSWRQPRDSQTKPLLARAYREIPTLRSRRQEIAPPMYIRSSPAYCPDYTSWIIRPIAIVDSAGHAASGGFGASDASWRVCRRGRSSCETIAPQRAMNMSCWASQTSPCEPRKSSACLPPKVTA